MGWQARVDAAIDAALGSRIVGCVVQVSEGGKVVYARAAGLADREAGRAMQLDAIFRLASVTKPIVATAALRMVEAGLIALEDPVTRYLPYFTPKAPDGSVPEITLRQLMTHVSGVSYDVPPDISAGTAGPVLTLQENLTRLADVPLKFHPGTGWVYGMGIDVLGGVLAAVEGSLGAAVARHVTGPLGMVDTAFGVTDAARLAVPYADAAPPKRMGALEVLGDVWFAPDRILNPDVPQSGGAGMAGTAGDVMAMLEVYQTPGFLRAETVAEAMRNQTGPLDRGMGSEGKGFNLIGAVIHDARAAHSPCPVGTVDWGGVWGHNWIVDPVARRTIVVCTNTTFEGCNGPFREEIRDAVYG